MKSLAVFCLSIFIISSNTSGQNKTVIDENKTRQVYKHHDEAFGKRDLEGVLADYSEESILVTPDKTYIRIKRFERFF